MSSIKSPANDTASNQRPGDVPKERPCLRCSTPFHSTWSGDRVCSRCKNTAAWRNGNPLRAQSSRGGR